MDRDSQKTGINIVVVAGEEGFKTESVHWQTRRVNTAKRLHYKVPSSLDGGEREAERIAVDDIGSIVSDEGSKGFGWCSKENTEIEEFDLVECRVSALPRIVRQISSARFNDYLR